MQQMLKQVQKMQQDMELAQQELANETVEASAGGGMVTVAVSGELELRSVKIDPAAVDPEDVDMLCDLVLAATNEALRSAQELAASKMGAVTGGLDPARWRLGCGLRVVPGGDVSSRLSSFAPPVQRLVTELSKLPGIGNRTAQRLAFHILRASSEDALGLAEAIKEVKEKVGLCEVCFNLADEPRCRICQDTRRDATVICVVEEPSDVIPMERTHEFQGLYHVLGGALSPIDGVEPEDLKIDELYARVVARRAPAVREVVLATNPTTTGEATALHIAEELRQRARAPHLTVTRLGLRPAGWLGPGVRRRGHAGQGARRTRSRVRRRMHRRDVSYMYGARLAACPCQGPSPWQSLPSSRGRRDVNGSLAEVSEIVVMKFGGTSVADAERIKRAAARIVAKREAGYSVVAVLSARGKTTDELISMAEEVSAAPDPREMDMLLSTGERISCALCAMAINDLGHRAISLTGSQAGIVTDASHTKARILDVRADRMRRRPGRGPDRARRRLPGGRPPPTTSPRSVAAALTRPR